jgi:hypothetical protein
MSVLTPLSLSVSSSPCLSQNTAVIFFRRFYLCNSLRAHDPRLIMCPASPPCLPSLLASLTPTPVFLSLVSSRLLPRLACLFLSSKIEESFISPNELISKFFEKAPLESLLKKEEDLLAALNFQVNVSHPQTSITTFLSHYRNHLPPVPSSNMVCSISPFVSLSLSSEPLPCPVIQTSPYRMGSSCNRLGGIAHGNPTTDPFQSLSHHCYSPSLLLSHS